jgi:hypothetical protein
MMDKEKSFDKFAKVLYALSNICIGTAQEYYDNVSKMLEQYDSDFSDSVKSDHPVDDEWKELKIDNLPSDIYENSYEFEMLNNGHSYAVSVFADVSCIIQSVIECGYEYRYRKRQAEKKEPSHEDIMSWFRNDRGVWERVLKYNQERKTYLTQTDGWVNKEWFADKETSTTPPEN